MKLPKTSVLKGLALVACAMYIALLLKAILFKHPAGQSMTYAFSVEEIRFRLLHAANLTPLSTIRFYIANDKGSFNSLANLGGNVALFVPLGCMLPYFFPKLGTWRHIAGLSFLVSLALETVQLVTGLGAFDVDDLLLNLLGGLIGWALYRTVSNRIQRSTSVRKTLGARD